MHRTHDRHVRELFVKEQATAAGSILLAGNHKALVAASKQGVELKTKARKCANAARLPKQDGVGKRWIDLTTVVLATTKNCASV